MAASLSFYGEGHTPVDGDPVPKIANKILGAIIDSATVNPNVSPVFYSNGHAPSPHDSLNIIYQKILGAIIDTGFNG